MSGAGRFISKNAYRIFARLFEHRAGGAIDLKWHQVETMVRALGGSVYAPGAHLGHKTGARWNPTLRVQIGGLSKVFRTPSGHRHERKNIATQEDISTLRRLLIRAGAVNDAGEPSKVDVATQEKGSPNTHRALIVITHKAAHVFNNLHDQRESTLVPVPELLGHDRNTHHLHPHQQPPGGALASPKGGNYYHGVSNRHFVDDVRRALPDSGADVLIVGHGKGHSSAADALASVLDDYKSSGVAVLGIEKLDSHLTDKQLLAHARSWFTRVRGWEE